VRSLGLASTIVQLPEGLILREGAVPARTVRAALGDADAG
jgi:L-threonylcarbamoyladenylate synthase